MANRNLFQNPTKKFVLTVSILWFIGTTLLIAAVSKFFTQSIFQPQNYLILFFIAVITTAVFVVGYNYFKNDKED